MRNIRDLDTTDQAIIEQLSLDGRLSNTELAQRVRLTPAPCLRRVRRLEEDGIITGYHAHIDPKAAVHVLVIPKAHLAAVVALAADPAASADVLAAAAEVAADLRADGFRLIFNTGGYAGQEVFHVHAHVLGGEPLGPMLASR